VGGAVLVQSSAGNFLVSRTAPDTFAALTAVCTHEGCTITGYESSTYTCPCHGSQFSTTGGVLRGPAGRSLQSFATTFANGTLTIRRSEEHTSELQSRGHLVCRLLLEKKKK